MRQEATTEFFYLLVDLDKQQSVTVNDLFEEDAGTVNAALQSAVYARVSAQEGLAPIASKADVPMPKSYFVASPRFACSMPPVSLPMRPSWWTFPGRSWRLRPPRL